MKRFEYTITLHPADDFREAAFFCTGKGDCAVNDIPSSQVDVLKEVLNEKGADGWELVNISFGKEGLMAVWKREKEY